MSVSDGKDMALAEIVVRGPTYPVSVPAASGGQAILKRDCELLGWSLYESTGAAAATADLYDGSGTDGQFIARVVMASGAVNTFSFGPLGLELKNGLYVHPTTGSVAGAVYTRI